MTKIYITFSLLLLFISTYAQKLEIENVPAAVLKQFETMHPTAKNSKWEMDFENYQVDFKDGKIDKSIWFNKDGNWLKKSTLIISSELPGVVKDSLLKAIGGSFVDYSYEYIEKVEEINKENVYKITVKKNKLPQEFLLSEKGQLVEKEEEN